jgi:hypothetical protein
MSIRAKVIAAGSALALVNGFSSRLRCARRAFPRGPAAFDHGMQVSDRPPRSGNADDDGPEDGRAAAGRAPTSLIAGRRLIVGRCAGTRESGRRGRRLAAPGVPQSTTNRPTATAPFGEVSVRPPVSRGRKICGRRS